MPRVFVRYWPLFEASLMPWKDNELNGLAWRLIFGRPLKFSFTGPTDQLQQQRERLLEQHPPPRARLLEPASRQSRGRRRGRGRDRGQWLGSSASGIPRAEPSLSRSASPFQIWGDCADEEPIRVVGTDKVFRLHNQIERWEKYLEKYYFFANSIFTTKSEILNYEKKQVLVFRGSLHRQNLLN